MAIDDPAPDFAAIARGFGWWADGPIADPGRVGAAVAKAADHVLGTGRPCRRRLPAEVGSTPTAAASDLW
jgi:hypothetical protein